MVLTSVVHHSLDLVLILIDTLSGRRVDSPDIQFVFHENGKDNVRMLTNRGNGTYILMNSNRINCDLDINVKGYEPQTLTIDFETLNESMPLVEVFLIPSENANRFVTYRTLTGNLPGITEVSAVSLSEIIAHTDKYDKKRRELKVFEQGYRLGMEGSPYAVINSTAKMFTDFKVKEQKTTDTISLFAELGDTPQKNSSVARVIYGMASDDGTYFLRTNDNSRFTKFLIKFIIDNEMYFTEFDFNEPKEILMEELIVGKAEREAALEAARAAALAARREGF